MDEEQRLSVGHLVDDGTPVSLPVVEILTGRGFVTGKSGSGKSNTASVVVEQLLDAGYPVCIIDADGEYYGLKEEYELLHAGADEECDIQVSAEHAEKIAALALDQNVPIILDVSGYLDDDEADELIRETARHLFAKEKKLKKPFLLVVEECHEYIPEGGGMGETGKMLIKVGKRGRKHGLGIMGISQRPADVKKDFITQANWLVWHRLTWENDTKVVSRIVGSEYGEKVPDLDSGEAFVQTDWTDGGVRRIKFNRKETFDAGATPGLDDFERPELKSVSDALMDDLEGITEMREQEQNRVAELESRLENRNERIRELEDELESARNVSAAARKMANALAHGEVGAPEDVQRRLREKDERIRELEAKVAELQDEQSELGEFEAGVDESAPATTDGEAGEVDDAATADSPAVDGATSSAGETVGEEAEANETDEKGSGESAVWDAEDDEVMAYLERLRERGHELRDSVVTDINPETASLIDLAQSEPVVVRIDSARRESLCNEDHSWDVVATLARDGPMTVHEIDESVAASVEQIQSLLAELRKRSFVTRDENRAYALNREAMVAVVEDPDERIRTSELIAQWRE
ncbi:helicase HerA domain-containing protein [Halomicrococcus sp. NG-SE-24]|uniref:ATP-binding protein n=1 Tax=Halomicrococcus sp. NG-SE-24 TaxID=3436928 RepID=UPI003D96726A